MPKKDRAIGKVYLSFVIEKDGRITDAVVTLGLNFKCDEEALRLLRASKMWIPATLKSRKVRSKGVSLLSLDSIRYINLNKKRIDLSTTVEMTVI